MYKIKLIFLKLCYNNSSFFLLCCNYFLTTIYILTYKMTRDLIKKIFLFLSFFLSQLSYAEAYIDPGTGSMILQGILAIFAAVALYVGTSIKFIKNMFRKKDKKKETDKETSIDK